MDGQDVRALFWQADPAGFVRQTMAAMQQRGASGEVTTSQDVAEAVFHAATDPACPMILPAGAAAIASSEGR